MPTEPWGSSPERYATATGTYVAADEQRKAELRARYGFRPELPAGVDGTDTSGPETTGTPR